MEKRILMVCLGNICRSPIAEGVMQAKLQKYGIPGQVDSAGTLSYHVGHAPDQRSIDTARNHSIDISSQIARKFQNSDFADFDFIFSMDQSVNNTLKGMAKTPEELSKVHLFLDYAGYPAGTEVPDPYYSGKSAFEQVFHLIDEASENIINHWLPFANNAK